MKVSLALAVVALSATALIAQTAGDPRARLAAAREEASAARQRAERLEAQAGAARDAAERARAGQAAIAARIQAAEAGIGAAEAQIGILDRLQREQEQRLAVRQQPVVRLVAALETMARRPAAAVLVQPGSLDDLVHVRAVLAATAPEVAARTAGLRAELDRARQLRAGSAAALVALREGQRQVRAEQQQLVQFEAEQRRRSQALAGSARLEAERALALAEGSRDLEQLVRVMDAQGHLRDRLAGLPGPLPRPTQLSDAVPAEQVQQEQPVRLAYRLPVLGPVSRGFGETLPSGGRARGVTIAARPGAIVVAPAAGRVAFAGLYRGYGTIAIVDHGDGYVSVVTGLGANLARVGDTVDQGGPLGRAGPEGVTVELRRGGEAVDLTMLVG